MSIVAKSFSASRTGELSGLSKTMLDYLCRSNVLRPSARPCSGRGNKRLYSFSDVVLLRIVDRLLRNGISVSKLKTAFAALRKRHPEFASRSTAGALLVTDGKRVYLCQGREVIEDLVGGQLAFAFVIEIDGVRRDVSERATSIPVKQAKQSQPKRRVANG
jgi:DNA-binding transcriptional MerR regulator